jgi:putative membrane protein
VNIASRRSNLHGNVHQPKNNIKSEGFEMSFKLIFGLILAGMAALFIIQNVTTMELTFLFWTLSMSRALLMILIMAVGVILGWLLHGSVRRVRTIPMQHRML